ncbi:MAG TPA: hypothetical protein VEI26_01580 [Terriglobales bacterium]|nr:hypothetical protein [Terriglobales bacterium]
MEVILFKSFFEIFSPSPFRFRLKFIKDSTRPEALDGSLYYMGLISPAHASRRSIPFQTLMGLR